MKLYDGGRAPNPRRMRIFLAEKGIDVPLVPVDMAAMAHKSAEITALNPFQRLPILELDDGTILTESVAISRYFEELHPEPALFGRGAVAKAQVEMWNRRVELYLLASITAAFRHTHPAMVEWEIPQVATWGEVNRPKAVAYMKIMDDQLATNEFIAGSEYSIADITLLVAMDFLKPAKIQIPEEFVHLKRWHAAVSSRPSAKA
ncbi:glutathione S-transferase [Phyllobacterium brassicacearum]|uniref:Glutathione S-transferase n=1 Tax=Phyllobacterium brassicacearum TaxID=314235 RepID=A0A2P7BTF7_9HYPH|nr:glutathione S-transferase [Phyllobacterium brassicacearum]PSH69764.1 glutathione S-transferase [Phyllobacterium brassicacearum]TDQ34914.1 glutathione S-transferase [Phyllobacterium brassicacearum]